MSTPTATVRDTMVSNSEYQRLSEQHARYAAELDHLTTKPHLNADEQMEEIRLKKLKLWTKDQMQMLMRRESHASGSS